MFGGKHRLTRIFEFEPLHFSNFFRCPIFVRGQCGPFVARKGNYDEQTERILRRHSQFFGLFLVV